MGYKTGLSVTEGVASGVTPFTEASKRNVAILQERERGIPWKPTRVNTLQEDRLVFGDYNANMYGPTVARNLFKNAGKFGANVFGVRALDEGASATATGILTDGAPANQALDVVETQAAVAEIETITLTGSSGTANVNVLGTDYLATFNASLTQTADDFVTTHAATILSAHGIIVTANAGDLIFTANVAGVPFSQDTTIANVTGDLAGSFVQTQANVERIITVTPSNVSVGDTFTLTVGATAVNFVATAPTVANVTAGLKAAIDAEVLASPGGDWDLYLQGNTVVDNNTSLTIQANGSTITPSTTNGSSNNIIDIWAGQDATKDPGTWGNDLSVVVYPPGDPNGSVNNYLWEVYYKGVLVEAFEYATWTTAIAGINQRSAYIYLIQNSPTSLQHDIVSAQTVTLSGGIYVAAAESAYYPGGTPSAPTGMKVLDGEDIQFIICSEFHTSTMAKEGRDYAEGRGDCVYLANLPYLADDTMVASFATALQQATTSHVAGYNCWIKTSDQAGGFIWAPAIGAIFGAAFIRTPGLQRDHIWIPPGGVESALTDCIEISTNPISQETIDLWVQQYTTNVVTFRKGKGFFVLSSRTYSTDAKYMSLHIRMMTNWLVKTLNDNLLFALQKPNTPELKREVIVAIKAFFRPIYANGGLERTLPFDEALEVISDVTNNPLTQDRKIVNWDIDWIPVETTEAMRIRLNRNDGILIAKALES